MIKFQKQKILTLKMSSEIKTETEKKKNLKRVEAGKKGAEAKKMKAELKRKEIEEIKKENIQLKSITKDDDDEPTKVDEHINIYQNYIPLCITVLVIGLGLYMYKSKQVEPVVQQQPMVQNKETDLHDFK